MIKGSRLAVMMLLLVTGTTSIAFSQDQVSQTIYVFEEDFNGTLLSDVQITGQDAAGDSFEGMTESDGVAIISGQPGTWQFTFSKEGYNTLSLSYDVNETGEGAVYLEKEGL